MWPYIALLTLVLLTFVFLENAYYACAPVLARERKDKHLLIISFIFIILLSGLRSISVGADTDQYTYHFNRIVNGLTYVLDEQFEEGYTLYVKLITLITHDPQVFLFVTAVLINIPICWFISKYSEDKLLSIILYITVGSFTFQLTGIRQAMAMSLCAFSIYFALKRRPTQFILFVLLAATFHRSALMFLPVYFFGATKLNQKKFLLVVIACIVFFTSGTLFLEFSEILGYQEYVGEEGVTDGGGWTYVIMMLLSLALYLYNNISQKSENLLKESSPIRDEAQVTGDFFFAMMLFALVTYLIRYEIRVAERISSYYRMSLLILLPNALTKLDNSLLKITAKVVCVILAIALFFYWLQGSDYLYTFFMYHKEASL